MKNIIFSTVLSGVLLTGCGDKLGSEAKSNTTSSKAVKGHFFNQPYECLHESKVTSKRTGKTRTVKYGSYYFPEKGWRIDLTDIGADKAALGGRGVANLYTPSTRYDGVYRDDEGVVTRIKFATAWPRKEDKPDIALSNLPKKKKKNCNVIGDLSIFEFDYLDTLEVMGR